MLRFKFRSIVVTNLRRLMPLLAAAALVLSTAAAQADFGDQLFKLLPHDGAVEDLFGRSVAISGTIAIVGAIADDDACPEDQYCNSGSAYLFDTTTGHQVAKLLASDDAPHDSFGFSVAISGSTAIVGANRDDDNGDASGSVYLFDATTGQQLAKLLADDGAAGDLFGNSVAISGTTAIVGAWWDNDNGSTSGSAYLFDTTTGQQIAKLLPGDGAADDHFGNSVAISGTTAVVGAYADDDNGINSGSAYLFDTTTGQQMAKLMPDDSAMVDQFGFSVAISGTTAIVGARHSDGNQINTGAAYVFDVSDPTNPTQLAKLLADDGATSDQFGFSVAISGTTAIVGAYQDDNNSTDSGSAYLFDTTTGQQLAKLLPADGAEYDYFGRSVAISGSTAIVGSERDDDNGLTSGSAYLFCASSACDDDNPCTDDSCDPDSGCIHTPNIDPCDDGDACTDSDTCSGGTCGGLEIACDDDDACTDASCDPLVGCEFQINFDEGSECCDPTTGNIMLIDDDDACTEDACNPSTGAVAHSPICLDIKPGSCPNPFNRTSNGVLPVALIGSVNFDAQNVLLSSVQLSRADGIGGSVAPNEGPPGPHSVLKDVATPFDREGCGCHDLGSDGIADLMMKFKTHDMVYALQLDEFLGGEFISLLLTGSLDDGTPINAQDCIWLVPPEDIEPANAAVESNEPGAFVEVTALDLNFDSDGFTSFARAYVPGTVVNFTAEPASPGGYPFLRWVIDGAPQPVGTVTVDVTITDDLTLQALYDLPCEGDLDGDDAVGASDLAQLLGSWGPCPPEGECPADFDEHSTIDAADLAFLLGSWGPCP